MNAFAKSCFICGCSQFSQRTPEYQRCAGCGHETLVASDSQGFILNDPLTLHDAQQVSGLDRFKAATLARFDREQARDQLLDIGSASGKFLYLNQQRYQHAVGLEITPAALQFSRDVLKLDIREDIASVPRNTSVATAWHSLEHIPEGALQRILSALSETMKVGARLIVSVPNADSNQYRLFGKSYAYYDVPNHLHQFSVMSLRRLLQQHGFVPVEVVRSRPYNTFGFIQGLLNVVTGTHNYLYYRLKRRSQEPSIKQDLIHALLLPFVVPVGGLMGLLEGFHKDTQSVITACFEKSDEQLPATSSEARD